MRSVFKKFLGLLGKEEKEPSNDVKIEGEISHNYLVLDDTVDSNEPSSHEIHSILNILENNKDINDIESLSISLSDFKLSSDKEELKKREFLEKPNIQSDRAGESLLEAQRLEVERIVAERLEAQRLVDAQLEEERKEAQKLEVERLVLERFEQARIEAERVKARELELERIEAERVKARELELERIEAERAKARKLELERIEAERAKARELELERIEAERVKARELELERIETERAKAQMLQKERKTRSNKVPLDILDSQEDLEEYASEDTHLQIDLFEIAEDFLSDTVTDDLTGLTDLMGLTDLTDPTDLTDLTDLRSKNKSSSDDFDSLAIDQLEDLLAGFGREMIPFDEQGTVERKLNEERLFVAEGCESVSPEMRIKQLVWDFIVEIDCGKAYKPVLESIFWGIHNTHTLVADHIVRRSKAQEQAIKDLIVDRGVTPFELELIFFLKRLWNDNEFLWSSFDFRRNKTSGTNFAQNYQYLSWNVSYEFIHAFPFLSDEILIEEFVFSLYGQWFENKDVHTKVRYKAFLFYLQEMIGIAHEHGERAHHFLRDYNGWFDDLEYISDELVTNEHMDSKVLLELDYAEL